MSVASSWVSSLFTLLVHPFRVDISDPRRLRGSIALSRILFGLLVIHQHLDCFGYAVVADSPQPIRTICTIAATAGLCLTLGLLTPLAIATLLVYFAYAPIVFYLGTMVSVPLLWGLLLLGAGQTHGLDALLLRRRLGQQMLRPLYLLAVSQTEIQVARVRFLLLVLFWGQCVSACVFHGGDDFWWRGTVLQVALTTPYWCDHYKLLATIRDGIPAVYVALCLIGLYVQVFWELFLVPLMYCRWGRVFVFGQGVAFFLVSLFLLNLQYLPLVEMALWILVFGYAVRVPVRPTLQALRELARAALAAWRRLAEPGVSLGDRGLGLLLLVALVAVVLQNVANCLTPPGPESPRNTPWLQAQGQPLFRLFGQGPVNVFNEKDLRTGATYFVLYETDEEGRRLRVVPFMDDEGGRLDYLRNDLLYYGHSLPWQRIGWEAQFGTGRLPRPTAPTAGLVRRVALLDALLTSRPGPRHYRAEFFTRRMEKESLPAHWGSSRHVLSLGVTLDEEMLVRGEREERYCFNVLPGHVASISREHRTMATLQQLAGGAAWTLLSAGVPRLTPPGPPAVLDSPAQADTRTP